MSTSNDKQVDLISLWDLTSIARRRASDMGVTVSFDPYAPYPYYTNSKIVFPEPKLPMTEGTLARLRYMYIHEPLHHTRKITLKIGNEYVKASNKGKEKPMPETFSFVWNVIEDTSMERAHAIQYEGDRMDMSLGIEDILKEKIEKIKTLKPEELAPDMRKIMAIQSIELDSRTDWDVKARALLAEYLSVLPEDVRKLYELLKQAGWVDRFTRAKSQYIVHDLARQLHGLIFPHIDMPPPPLCAQPQQGEDDNEDQSEGEDEQDGGDASEDGMGEAGPRDSSDQSNDCNASPENQEAQAQAKSMGEGGFEKQDQNAQASEGCGEGNDGEKVEGKAVIGEIPWEELTKVQPLGTLGRSHESRVNWEGKEENGNWSPCREEYKRVTDLSKVSKRTDPPIKYYEDRPDDKALANQVRRHIQILTRSKIASEKLTGKIHNRNISRIAVPQVGDGTWNRRIFKQKQEGLDIDTCVQVLIDSSGSMTGQKMIMACQSGQSLLYVFDRVLHIPTEILMFGSGKYFEFGVVKDFNDQRYTREDIARRMKHFEGMVSGNQDPDAVLWASSRLSRRPEKRKILIVLSDGSPTCADCDVCHGDADAGLKQVVSELKKKGNIEIYGIGIKDDNVKRYYGSTAKVVRNIKELNPVLLETIKEGVIHD